VEKGAILSQGVSAAFRLPCAGRRNKTPLAAPPNLPEWLRFD